MNFPSTVPGDTALVLQAVQLATKAHHGQRRKYTNEPYIMHCLAVAYGVANRTMDPHVIAAAVLHDTLEDTKLTVEHIRATISERTALLVVALTDVYTPEAFPHLNRKARKACEAERIGQESAEVQLIKAYDLMDNTRTIGTYDPGFASVYLGEKRMVLTQMTKLDPHERLLLETACNLPAGSSQP